MEGAPRVVFLRKRLPSCKSLSFSAGECLELLRWMRFKAVVAFASRFVSEVAYHWGFVMCFVPRVTFCFLNWEKPLRAWGGDEGLRGQIPQASVSGATGKAWEAGQDREGSALFFLFFLTFSLQWGSLGVHYMSNSDPNSAGSLNSERSLLWNLVAKKHYM